MSKIKLDAWDFYWLVSWEILKKDWHEIMLQDIGYDMMINNIDHAIQNKPQR